MRTEINEIIDILNSLHDGKYDNKTKLIKKIEDFSTDIPFDNWFKTVLSESLLFLSADIRLENYRSIKCIVELLQDIQTNYSKVGYIMYENSAWSELLNIRSPFEYLTIRKCSDCGFEYGYAAIGDYAELGSFNCLKCKAMYVGPLQAIGYDVRCKNNEGLVFGKCPNCMTEKFDNERPISPYEYFQNYKFFRDKDECMREK